MGGATSTATIRPGSNPTAAPGKVGTYADYEERKFQEYLATLKPSGPGALNSRQVEGEQWYELAPGHSATTERIRGIWNARPDVQADLEGFKKMKDTPLAPDMADTLFRDAQTGLVRRVRGGSRRNSLLGGNSGSSLGG